MSATADVIAAATSTDPGRVYAVVLAEPSLCWSEQRRFWIAARPEDVSAVLAHPACHVRPLTEPIPRALQATRIGDVFSRLARMNDGDVHTRMKAAVSQAFVSVDFDLARTVCRRLAEDLATQGDLDRFLFELPVMSITSLLGVPEALLTQVSADIGQFVRSLSPTASGEELADGTAATIRLCDILEAALAYRAPGTLMTALASAFATGGDDGPGLVAANAIGFLFQAHDATAGLIGNAVVHLARNRDAVDRASPLRPQVERLVGLVARDDAPVQNTRRFVARDVTVNGVALSRGDVVLVALAAANVMSNDQSWSFGEGRHACPGESLARMIAVEGVVALLERGMFPESLSDPVRYRPLPNARIPVFAPAAAEGDSR